MAVAADGPNAIYVAGTFTVAGAVRVNNIAKWNGTAWEAMGTGLTGAEGRVLALSVDAEHNLIAAGHFTNAGGILAMNMMFSCLFGVGYVIAIGGLAGWLFGA